MCETKTVIAFSVIGLISLEARAGAEQSFDVADFTRVAASHVALLHCAMAKASHVSMSISGAKSSSCSSASRPSVAAARCTTAANTRRTASCTASCTTDMSSGGHAVNNQ